ncbi:zinc ribbon domain-containing protein [Aeromonas sobria]|uniref:Ubiquitin--protein ligase n=1 Tax=Aeromonas sobria TaxID=646 RepID=A0A1S2D4X9_AERSO|nr:zinc ribbon domain-containing protein [Aeromonas sobria]MBS4687591.1 zinc ribbon domain-containing protein [Aeromonas sobria]OHY95073.1 ubiquitin--protein ligase [Aeromonas sobria]
MEALLCPSCQAELDARSKEQTCGQCQAHVRVTAICPTCQQELERLQACGAVDYFCNHCNSLVSKRTVQFKAALA